MQTNICMKTVSHNDIPMKNNLIINKPFESKIIASEGILQLPLIDSNSTNDDEVSLSSNSNYKKRKDYILISYNSKNNELVSYNTRNVQSVSNNVGESQSINIDIDDTSNSTSSSNDRSSSLNSKNIDDLVSYHLVYNMHTDSSPIHMRDIVINAGESEKSITNSSPLLSPPNPLDVHLSSKKKRRQQQSNEFKVCDNFIYNDDDDGGNFNNFSHGEPAKQTKERTTGHGDGDGFYTDDEDQNTHPLFILFRL